VSGTVSLWWLPELTYLRAGCAPACAAATSMIGLTKKRDLVVHGKATGTADCLAVSTTG